MEIKVKVYDGSKYEASSKKVAEVVYKNVKTTRVVKLSDEEIYEMGFDDVDPNGEYFIIELDGCEVSTFRNSFVDAFMLNTLN